MTRVGNVYLSTVVLSIALFGFAGVADANWWVADPAPVINITPPPSPCPGSSIAISAWDTDTLINTEPTTSKTWQLTSYSVTLSGGGLVSPVTTGSGPASVQIPKGAHGNLLVTVTLTDDFPPSYVHDLNGPWTKTQSIEVACSCDVKHGGATSGGNGGGDSGNGGGSGGCGSCGGGGTPNSAASSGTGAVRSAYLSVSVGHALNGESAGFITMEQESSSADLATPSVLHYDFARDDVHVYRNSSNILQQIMAPECFVDIVTTSPYEYEIRFYTPTSATGPDAGPWTLSGSPTAIAKWVIANPNTSSNYNELLVTRMVGTTTMRKYDFVASNTKDWALSIGDDTGYGRVEKEAWDTATLNGVTVDVCHYTIQASANGPAVYSVDEYYKTFDWGQEIVKKVVDPAGAALTTLRTYYTLGTTLEGLLETERRADGSWTWHGYDPLARPTWTIESWNDVPLPDPLPDPLSFGRYARRTDYNYWHLDTNDDGTVYSSAPRTVTVTVDNQIAAQTYYAYYLNGSSNLVQIEKRCASAGSSYGDSGNLVTTTIYELSDLSRPLSVQYPDGRLDTYTYDLGVFDRSTTSPGFTPGSGTDERVSVRHRTGTPANPTSVNYKSTQDCLVRDQFYRNLLAETYVYDGTDYSNRIGWTVRQYDTFGHLTDVYASDGTHTHDEWSCCARSSSTDAAGVETDFVVDKLGRITTMTRLSLAATDGSHGSFDAQSAVVTRFTYDAFGSVLTRKSGASDPCPTITNTYDGAQRLASSQNAALLTTTYAYTLMSYSGRQVTVTRPSGATEITAYYADGGIQSVSGTGVVSRAYQYEVLSSGAHIGHLVGTTRVGTSNPLDMSAARWSSRRTDLLGRVAEEQQPAPASASPSTLSTQYTYVSGTGLLTRVQRTQNAGTRYVYDSLAQVIKTVVDANDDGTIDDTGPDRVTHVETTYYLDGGSIWWRKQETSVMPTTGSSTELLVSKTQTRLTGLSLAGVVAETKSWDVLSNLTDVTTTLDLSNHVLTQTANVPESTTDAVQYAHGGWLVRSTTSSGITTNYAYDTLGRRTGVGDGRGKWTATDYDATTGQVTATRTGLASATATGGLTTTYSYYSPTTGDANAGRLQYVEEPTVGSTAKRTYYKYDAYGQVTNVWGSGTYPTLNTYEGDYHERTKLTTFRDGDTYDFTPATWPSGATASSGDTTVWTYDAGTGLATRKTCAGTAATHVDYAFTAAGRLHTRTWSRQSGGLVTTYTYADSGSSLTGELTGLSYNDSGLTPDLTFTYERLGRLATVSDAAGTRALAYDSSSLAPTTETYGSTGTQLFTNLVLTQQYEDGTGTTVAGRFAGLEAGTSGAPSALYAASYGYDAATGRLASVQGPGLPASTAYTYTSGTDYAGTLEFKNSGGTVLLRESRTLESSRPVLSVVSNWWQPSGQHMLSQYSYTTDNRGQRTAESAVGDAVGDVDGFSWTFGYNPRGELTSGSRSSDPFGSAYRGYTYDPIGNRKTSTDNSNNPTQVTYVANAVNQYTTPSLGYDDDGDMTSDGGFGGAAAETLVYDGENRLTAVLPSSPTTGSKEVKYTYDYRNRRVQRRVFNWDQSLNGGNGDWSSTVSADTRYVWDGWLLLAELDGTNSNALLRKYTWGLDLAGQWAGGLGARGVRGALEAAGGIGGLLAVREGSSTDYVFTYNANGNVSEVVNLGPATWNFSTIVVARYQYDPYGNVVYSDGSYKDTNRWRFSTKQFDSDTGLGYWGERWYSTTLGRWLSRDPMAEQGGANLYIYTANNPIDTIDGFGLIPRTGGFCWYWNSAWPQARDAIKGFLKDYVVNGFLSDDDLTALADRITDEMTEDEFNKLKEINERKPKNKDEEKKKNDDMDKIRQAIEQRLHDKAKTDKDLKGLLDKADEAKKKKEDEDKKKVKDKSGGAGSNPNSQDC